jgi:hypothetical protein
MTVDNQPLGKLAEAIVNFLESRQGVSTLKILA